jgi:hypothetical protein
MKTRALKTKLDALCKSYDREYLSSDPLMFLHEYSEPADIEVVGLISAALAYGRVAMIQRSVRRILDLMGAHPARYVRRFDARARASDFSDFSHRFNRGDDIILLLGYMKQMIALEGSIGGFFRAGYEPDAPDIGGSLASFTERTLALDCSAIYTKGILPKKAGVRYFFRAGLRALGFRTPRPTRHPAGHPHRAHLLPDRADAAQIAGLADGAGDHRKPAETRPGRSHQIRLRDLPPGNPR